MSIDTSESFVDVLANCVVAYFLEVGVFASVAFSSFVFLVVGKRLVNVEGCRETECVVANELRVGVFGFPWGDEAKEVEASMFKLNVGESSVGAKAQVERMGD